MFLLVRSILFHVFELARPLPMFSMYLLIENSLEKEPRGFVTFYINERIPRVSDETRFSPNSRASFPFMKDSRLDQLSLSSRTRIRTEHTDDARDVSLRANRDEASDQNAK